MFPICRNSQIIMIEIIESKVFAIISGNSHFLLIIVSDNTRPIKNDFRNQITLNSN